MEDIYEIDFDFLDLSNLDDRGKKIICKYLTPVTDKVLLPWDKEESVDEIIVAEQQKHQQQQQPQQQQPLQQQQEPQPEPQQQEPQPEPQQQEPQQQEPQQEEPQQQVPQQQELYKQLPQEIQHQMMYQFAEPSASWRPYEQPIDSTPMYDCLYGHVMPVTFGPWPVMLYGNQKSIMKDMGIHPAKCPLTKPVRQDVPVTREGGRRNRGRGKSSKNFNRNMNNNKQANSTEEIQVRRTGPLLQYDRYPDESYVPKIAIETSYEYRKQRESQNLVNGESKAKCINHKSNEKMRDTHFSNSLEPFHLETSTIYNKENDNQSVSHVHETSIINNNGFLVKTEQDVDSSTSQENSIKIEKNEISHVNNSRFDIRENGNIIENNENMSRFNTVTSANRTSIVSKPVAKSAKEKIINKKIKDVQVKKIDEIREEKVLTEAKSGSNESKVPVITPTVTKSWASIVKKTCDSSNVNVNKSTSIITNNNITDQSSVDKALSPSPTIGHHNNQESFEENLHCRLPLHAMKMGEFLLTYELEKQAVSLAPRGLTNRSNYCYINSILQALLACPPFYNLFMAIPYSKHTSKHSPSPLIDNMIKFMREFTPLPEGSRLARRDRVQKRTSNSVLDIQSDVPFEPSYMYTVLKNASSPGVFCVGRQEDAEEFLSCLLNGISDEMTELMKLASCNEQKTAQFRNNKANSNEDEDDEWKIMGPKNKGSITRNTDFDFTPLSEIFKGQLRSRVQRASEQPTDCVQPFFTLQLEVKRAESVRKALDILVGKDHLEGMICSKTKQEIEAWKQVTLEELPVVLILHLKWFDYSHGVCSKIIKKVDFPVDLKIDNKQMSSNARQKFSQKQRQYKLFAVTYHDGREATKGHYVTDAYHVGYGGWLRYDDSSVKSVSEANVLNPKVHRVPYLLYYRRSDTIGSNQSNNVNA